MMKNTILTFIVMFLSLGVSSQTVEYVTNVPRSGDILKRQLLEPFSEGDDGHGIVWDFSSLSVDSDDMEYVDVEYFIDPDSSRLSAADGDVILRYSVFSDTLKIIGRETTLERICYDAPQTAMTYPFAYGDVISCSYEGHGTYCSRLNVRVEGTLRVESDADGIIITGECDTLFNVLRVHSLRTGSICMHPVSDVEYSDTSHIKQEIEDCYEWYARGYRYPLYRTATIAYYDDMTLVSSTHSASRISPDFMHVSDDPGNDSICAHDAAVRDAMSAYGSLSYSLPDCDDAEYPDIIHYTVSMDDRTLLLDYDLDSDATLTCVVCNKMGMLFVSRRERVEAGSGYTMEFDFSGFVPNEYILYINVNGTVYSEKFKVE